MSSKGVNMRYRITDVNGRATFHVSWDEGGEDVTADKVTMLAITPLAEPGEMLTAGAQPDLIKLGMTPEGFKVVVRAEDHEYTLIINPDDDGYPIVERVEV